MFPWWLLAVCGCWLFGPYSFGLCTEVVVWWLVVVVGGLDLIVLGWALKWLFFWRWWLFGPGSFGLCVKADAWILLVVLTWRYWAVCWSWCYVVVHCFDLLFWVLGWSGAWFSCAVSPWYELYSWPCFNSQVFLYISICRRYANLANAALKSNCLPHLQLRSCSNLHFVEGCKTKIFKLTYCASKCPVGPMRLLLVDTMTPVFHHRWNEGSTVLLILMQDCCSGVGTGSLSPPAPGISIGVKEVKRMPHLK